MKKVFAIIFLNLIVLNCGYKVVDKTKQRNFYIAEIINSGDSRINFKIKNKLLFYNLEDKEKMLSLNVNSSKKKIFMKKMKKTKLLNTKFT